MGYKCSKYNRIYPLGQGEYWIHNLYSGSECIIDENEKLLLSNVEKGKGNIAGHDEELRELEKLGFIVLKDTDELSCLQMERQIAAFNIKDQVGFTIAPTMECNAQCFYCYEPTNLRKGTMSSETADKLIQYICKQSERAKLLHISWFGGEPLMSRDIMLRISDAIIDFCSCGNIGFSAELTTNGSLLDNNILDRCRISDTQVTLDGVDGVHNRRKNYLDYPDAFHKTIDNVFSAACTGHEIVLRINFDRPNYRGIFDLVDCLLGDPRWNNSVAVYFQPLEPSCLQQEQTVFAEEEYEECMYALHRHLFNAGYYRNRSMENSISHIELPCYGASYAHMAVDPIGNLYHCQHLLGMPDKIIGTINDGISVNIPYLEWFTGEISEKCEKCDILPLCQGGCRAKSYLGQNKYLCHMMKYKLRAVEEIKLAKLRGGY